MTDPKTTLEISDTAAYAFCNPNSFPTVKEFFETRLAVLEYMVGEPSKVLEYGSEEIKAAIQEAERFLYPERLKAQRKAERKEEKAKSGPRRLDYSPHQKKLAKQWRKTKHLGYEEPWQLEQPPEKALFCEYCDTALNERSERVDGKISPDAMWFDHVPPIGSPSQMKNHDKDEPKRIRVSCRLCNQLLSDFPSVCMYLRVLRIVYRIQVTDQLHLRGADKVEHMIDRLAKVKCQCSQCKDKTVDAAIRAAKNDPSIVHAKTPRK